MKQKLKIPESKNSQQFGKFIESLRTFVLFLLVVSLACLVVIYIGGTNIYQQMIAKENGQDMEKLWSVQSSTESNALVSERLLPETVVLGLPSHTPVAAVADTEMIDELYALLKPCIRNLFGKDATVSPVLPDGEQQFYRMLSANEYVYLRYHEPIPYSFIYAYISDKFILSDRKTASDDILYVSEMVLIPSSETAADSATETLTAVIHDGNGSYYRFTVQGKNIAANLSLSKLDDYAETLIPATFFNEHFSPSQPIPAASVQTNEITASVTNPRTTGYSDILRLFGYNPSKLDSYTDGETLICYDTHSRLLFEPSRFIYQAGDSSMGLKFDTFLAYSSDGKAEVYDMLAAADALLTKIKEISPELIGGEASLCLGNVYAEEEMVTFEYLYLYNSVYIRERAVRITFSGEYLYHAEINTTAYHKTDISTFDPGSHYIIENLCKIGLLTDKTNCLLQLQYRCQSANMPSESFSETEITDSEGESSKTEADSQDISDSDTSSIPTIYVAEWVVEYPTEKGEAN